MKLVTTRTFIVFVFLGGLITGTARAAEPMSYDWTGLYIGAHAGYGWGESDVTLGVPNSGFWGPVGGTGDLDPDGFVAGGQIGYMVQHNSLVFGVDASVSGADIDDKIDSPFFVGDEWDTAVEALVLIQGRLGWAQDAWLLFVQGGYAGADAEATANDLSIPPPATDSKWHNGWTIGAGVLWKFDEQFSIGAEYSYISLGRENYSWPSPGGAANRARIDHDIHVIKVTGNIHFGSLFGGM